MGLISNEQYSENLFKSEDLFVCTLGYEERSYFLLDKLMERINKKNILVFVFSDFEKYEHTSNKVKKLIEDEGLDVVKVDYKDYIKVLDTLSCRINSMKELGERVNIHVDYSSMPRSWYCRFPQVFKNNMRTCDKAYFWYVEGMYPEDYEEYPSAGIDSFSLFSGTPTLRTGNKRTHVMALNFDTVRTQATMSILDPESVIVCNAYDSRNKEVGDKVKLVNSELISQARMLVSLQIDDFRFIVSKLCELAYEYQSVGDVVFVPDGPKPLIFAMSMIPDIVELHGVTCLHISRNEEFFNPTNVRPQDIILGFSMKGNISE